ncbi:MAG: 50S ribosomal protein L18 [Candidatus Micrarchaeaceae archaeon]
MTNIFKVGFKRKRTHMTNYKKRLSLIKSDMTRVVIRRSNKSIISQIVKYSETGDIILVTAYSHELSKYGWPSRSNRMTAYLTGMLLAKKAAVKKLENEDYILDIGLSAPVKNSTPFVFAQGCIDGGLKLRSGLSIEKSIFEKHNEYVKKLKEDKAVYEKIYSAYIKSKVNPEELFSLFEKVKTKILNE